MDSLLNYWEVILSAVETADPVALFLAAAFLPLLGVPASPLWIAVGVRMGTLPAFVFCLVALLLNFSAGYWLARCGVRVPLARWLERHGWRIPRLPKGDESSAILMLRVTPGVPLCVQNYLLGLAEVPFGKYLIISIPAQAAYALAFVWLGDSLASNKVWHVLLGVAALTGLLLLVGLIRSWLGRRSPKTVNIAAHESKTAD